MRKNIEEAIRNAIKAGSADKVIESLKKFFPGAEIQVETIEIRKDGEEKTNSEDCNGESECPACIANKAIKDMAARVLNDKNDIRYEACNEAIEQIAGNNPVELAKMYATAKEVFNVHQVNVNNEIQAALMSIVTMKLIEERLEKR